MSKEEKGRLGYGWISFKPYVKPDPPPSTWKIVAVVGIPSADLTKFKESIRFETYEMQAKSEEQALESDPNPTMLGEKESLLNWYAFETEVKC